MLKQISQTLKSVTPISHLHTRNKTLISNPAIDFILSEFEDLQSPNLVKNNNNSSNNPAQFTTKPSEPDNHVSSSTQISHQWPEWIGLMEKLMKFGYFDGVKNPFQSGQMIDGKGCNRIRTACLNFARDRADLMRCFMNRDVEMIAGSGCPSIDRKVVNSGKRLRAHLGIDEGNVCSSCKLRKNCERAYMKPNLNEGGPTVDIMRILLTYALDYNKPIINVRLEEAIRRLIKHMVKFSNGKVCIDRLKRVPHVNERPTQQQEHRLTSSIFQERVPGSRDHVQLKGDWLCIRCNFFNYAKNTRCLQCHTNPPKRRLNPGEWECDSCNYINFKRNMACLKCDHKRPKAFNNSTLLQQSNLVD